MKKLFTFIFIVFLSFAVKAQIINFPDSNFKARLLSANASTGVAYDVNGNYITIDTNQNGEIEVSEALTVYSLDISNAQLGISDISDLTGISNFTNLTGLLCLRNTLSSINLTSLVNLVVLEVGYNQLTNLNLTGLISIRRLICNDNQLTALNLSGLPLLDTLNCSSNQISNLNVSTNVALTELDCRSNQLAGINVNGLINVVDLYLGFNLITTIDLNGLSQLQRLNLDYNQLQSIDLNGLISLRIFSCVHNQLNTLEVNFLSNLTGLFTASNLLTNLDISELKDLEYLSFSYNQIHSIDITGLHLKSFDSYAAPLTTVDVSGQYALENLSCGGAPELISIFMKNSSAESFIEFSNSPNLRYICADNSQIDEVQTLINQYGYTNCEVNSYCSFVPGGVNYIAQGTLKYAQEFLDCNASTITAPNIRLNISDGTEDGRLFTNDDGQYSISLQAGTYSVIPQFEHPTYFYTNPPSVTISFPIQTSPHTANFCIYPYGTHYDLDATIVPLGIPFPGSDTSYKILYKNKGTAQQSGSVTLAYENQVEFITASQTPSTSASNLLTWNFTNLMPFEVREIIVTFNANTPSEVPSVNNGDIITYTARVLSAENDETTFDNHFVIHQRAVNSFDPNNKTCLEGEIVETEYINEYVHYMIRFENTGTANAQNIVVKDMIDTTKFDIDSLIPIDGSAPFVTRINGDKVEFIFENIQLPFDNANNDGYVAFKIKTKPTLVLGDTFSNTASIYFDYNAPIVTNTATTTISALAKQDFAFDDYFRVYPNPATNVLNIDMKKHISISSVSIYNTLGQLVLIATDTVRSIDVSSLKSGNYFLKIQTDKGASNQKFIKQ